jgi:hypothetical protein
MSRGSIGRLLAAVAAAGFVGTAALHATGYPSVTRLSSEVRGRLGAAIPGLWLAFSVDLAVLGMIMGVVALRPGPGTRLILALASLCPLSAAALQMHFLGFIPPTAILLGVGLTAAAACVVGPASDIQHR